MFRVIALCAFSIMLPAVASAEDRAGSANYVMSGCRSFIGRSAADPLLQGVVRGPRGRSYRRAPQHLPTWGCNE